jgi:uncharacterized protein (TIGR00251 family)
MPTPPSLEIRPADGGRAALLGVRAQPGARREGIAGTWNGLLKIAVRAPALEGRANEELVRVLAEALALRAAQVTIERGGRSRAKELRVELSPDELRARLERLLP